MTSKTIQMVTALRAGNTSEALTSFQEAVTEKMHQALDERKVALATELYSEDVESPAGVGAIDATVPAVGSDLAPGAPEIPSEPRKEIDPKDVDSEIVEEALDEGVAGKELSRRLDDIANGEDLVSHQGHRYRRRGPSAPTGRDSQPGPWRKIVKRKRVK